MGEYATLKRTGEQVKLGTCSNMYYCTIKQRHQVTGYQFTREHTTMWRLPLVPMIEFENKDGISYQRETECKEAGDGNYEDWKFSSCCLIDNDKFFKMLAAQGFKVEDNVGSFQISHRCGYLMNVPCYHGTKCPDDTGSIRVGWNGRDGYHMRMEALVTKGDNVDILVTCKYCGKSWIVTLDELRGIILCDEKGEMIKAIEEEIEDWKNNK